MTSSPVPIYVATRDGQSERIAQHVFRWLTDHGIAAELRVLPAEGPVLGVQADAPAVVVIAAVRYGRHLPEAEAFLARYGAAAAPRSTPPLALASVNLTARKAGRQSAEENPYLRKAIRRLGLRPAVALAIAGRLDYPRYKWFDRQMIRLIMAMTGGPTDGRACVEYTSWDQVDAFASAVAGVVEGGAQARCTEV